MRLLELKIPPPVFTLALAILMWLVARVAPFAIPFPWHDGCAIVFALAGVLTSIAGVVTFRRAGTTLNPTTPAAASSLMTGGIYALTRNPMYLGLLLVLTGWAYFLANPLAFVFLPVYVVYIGRFQITPEERALAALFTKEFADYKTRTRRWL